MIFSRRKTIGVFISKMFSLFDNAVFRALEREGKRLDYDIVVFATVGYFLTKSDYDEQEKNIFRFAAVDKLDGIIIVPDSYEKGEFRELLYDMLRRNARCPIVAIRHDGREYDCVYTDEGASIRPLVRHLIEDHGLKRICFQSGFPGNAEADARREAYEQEMADHGLPVPEGGVCSGNMWLNCGEQAYEALFGGAEKPEAVVCANDYMAVGLMRALQKRGIRVPEDVIVTGFDNVPCLGVDVPGLTTVQPDFDGMVVRAMERLVGAFENALAQLNPKGERTFEVCASCGYVVRRIGELDTIERCIQMSDRQMYRAKEAHHAARE